MRGMYAPKNRLCASDEAHVRDSVCTCSHICAQYFVETCSNSMPRDTISVCLPPWLCTCAHVLFFSCMHAWNYSSCTHFEQIVFFELCAETSVSKNDSGPALSREQAHEGTNLARVAVPHYRHTERHARKKNESKVCTRAHACKAQVARKKHACVCVHCKYTVSRTPTEEERWKCSRVWKKLVNRMSIAQICRATRAQDWYSKGGQIDSGREARVVSKILLNNFIGDSCHSPKRTNTLDRSLVVIASACDVFVGFQVKRATHGGECIRSCRAPRAHTEDCERPPKTWKKGFPCPLHAQ
jgi:hypothetical protein